MRIVILCKLELKTLSFSKNIRLSSIAANCQIDVLIIDNQ